MTFRPGRFHPFTLRAADSRSILVELADCADRPAMQQSCARSNAGQSGRPGVAPISLNNDLTRLRIMLKFADDERLIDHPVKRVLRKLKGERLFSAEEIRKLLAAADLTLKAMILLGINAGMTPIDVGSFPQSAIDASRGKVYFPRAKTDVKRHSFLWPETLEAISRAGGLPFKTRRGAPWSQSQVKNRSLSKKMGKLMDAVGIDRGGRNFYTLRHTFQTVADAAPYSKAHVVRHIMGHSDSSPERDLPRANRRRTTKVRDGPRSGLAVWTPQMICSIFRPAR